MRKARRSPAPSPEALRAGGSPLRRLASFAALGLLAALLVACSGQQVVVSSNPKLHREVLVLSGATPAQPPADPAFAKLTALDVEASLRHVIVRPSEYFAQHHGDPQPLFTADQVAWARDAILAHLPALRPDQRLLLHFQDQFNGYSVKVALYGEGPELVYRFTELALPPPRPSMSADSDIRLSWAELVALPGQSLHKDDGVETLRDPIFAGAQSTQQVDLLDVLRRQAKQRKLSDTEVEPVKAVLLAYPEITEAALKLYLDKLQLVDKSEQEGLFTAQEAAQRRKSLLEQLTPGGAPAAEKR